uniref:Uncharacterized protein n=1 Tax=Kalanchoe fedtschenkoi TaxID=63787 RepID=A0A7N0UR32_KALFE
MRGTTAIFPSKNVLKQFYHPSWRGGCGIVATSSPKKQESHTTGEEKAGMTERPDPIVAFCRPPPLPPVFGPLVALSLLEAWTSRDNNDE